MKYGQLLQTKQVLMAVSVVVSMMTASLTGCTTLQPQPGTGYGVPVTERTLAQRILDRSIESTALLNINALDPTLRKRGRISVDSFYSQVLLTGDVPETSTKQQILALVAAMPDVKKVHDGLNISEDKGASYTVHDGYITSKINAKILANDAIKSSQVKVVSEDGIVYVLGKLTPTQRGHLMNIVDSTVGVKKQILLAELIDDYGAIIDDSVVSQEPGLEPPTYITDNNGNQMQQAPIYSYGDGGTNTVPNVPAAPTYDPPVYSMPEATVPTYPNNSYESSGYPTAPTYPSQPSTYQTSPYIELYKDDVPGWQ